MERCEISAMEVEGLSLRTRLFVRPLNLTAEPTGLMREPWQARQTMSSSASMRSMLRSASSSASRTESKREVSRRWLRFGTFPWPRQTLHQPWGELKEKRRGSSSSNERLQQGQLEEVERRMSSLSAVKSLMRPLPMSNALASAVESEMSFEWRLKVTTTTSMSCSTKRSRRVKVSASLNCLSTRSVVNPCFTAQAAISVW